MHVQDGKHVPSKRRSAVSVHTPLHFPIMGIFGFHGETRVSLRNTLMQVRDRKYVPPIGRSAVGVHTLVRLH